MPNQYFRFKKFTVWQHRCAMKVTTDGCLFGAWCADEAKKLYSPPNRILDIGAGTGLLSLMMAQQSAAHIDAVEIEPQAAAQTGENVAASPWKENIRVIERDILSYQPPQLYDCIICNPPFYENDLASPNVQRAIAHHDTGLALWPLLQQAKRLLTDDGTFFLLLPARRKDEILKGLAENGWHLHQLVDVYPVPSKSAFRMMLTLGRKPTPEVKGKNFFIRNAKGDYNQEFIYLLKDYYLYL